MVDSSPSADKQVPGNNRAKSDCDICDVGSSEPSPNVGRKNFIIYGTALGQHRRLYSTVNGIMSGTAQRNTSAKRRLFGKQTEGSEDIRNISQNVIVRNEEGRSDSAVTILDCETPQKKSTSRHDLFFSPKSKPVVTPDKVEDDGVEVFSPPSKKTRLSEIYSPQPRHVGTKTEAYIPTYIHKNLSYRRHGTASLPSNVKGAFDLVQEHYEIPVDFEESRSYGPLSGTSFEERVITAYNLSQLEPKNGEGVQICSICVTLGHKRNDCPDLI